MMLPIKLLRRRRLLWHSAIVVAAAAAAAAFAGDQTSIGWQHSTQNHKRPCSSNTNILHADRITRAYLTKHDSLRMDDPRVESRVPYKIDISLPLGLTLEDMDSDPSYGVVIVGISPEGNAGETIYINITIILYIESRDCYLLTMTPSLLLF
jgi:hypothetical protein